jgi:hypothetical protein
MAPKFLYLYVALFLSLSAITFSYGATVNELERKPNDWKDKLNRHVANKNPHFVNNRYLQSSSDLLQSGRRNAEISFDDPDMQMLQRGANNGFDFSDNINEQFEATIAEFQNADSSTILTLFQNIELLQGSETYRTMVVGTGRDLTDLSEAELRQLAVGSIMDTKDASTDLISYTRLTDEEKQEKIDRFGAENSELGERIKNGDEAAYQEYQAKFQRQEITTKYDSEAMKSDEKLRKRQNAFQTDSQLRMAIGDEELLAIMDSPNLSFKPDFSGEN